MCISFLIYLFEFHRQLTNSLARSPKTKILFALWVRWCLCILWYVIFSYKINKKRCRQPIKQCGVQSKYTYKMSLKSVQPYVKGDFLSICFFSVVIFILYLWFMTCVKVSQHCYIFHQEKTYKPRMLLNYWILKHQKSCSMKNVFFCTANKLISGWMGIFINKTVAFEVISNRRQYKSS